MKLSRKLKTLMVAAAAVFILAATPAYSWTRDGNFGWNHRDYNRHNVYRGYPVNHRAYWGDYGRSWHRDHYHGPVYPGAFGINLPGFSVYVGP